MSKQKKEISMDDFEIIKTESISLNFYAIRNKDNKWLSSKNNYSKWSDNISDAKIYSNIGPVKARITILSKLYPDDGIPDLIWIVAGTCHSLDQKKRVTASLKKIEEERLRKRIYNINWHPNQGNY